MASKSPEDERNEVALHYRRPQIKHQTDIVLNSPDGLFTNHS